MILGKLKAFVYLLRETRGLGAKWALTRTLLFGEVRRPKPGTAPRLARVRFRPFSLTFRVGQGELTPYREINDVIEQLVKSGGGWPSVSQWVVLDCGANIGMFSLFLKDAQRVIAVEPNPDCCARIRENFAANGVHGEVVQKAVFSRETQLKMFIDPNASVLSAIGEQGNTTVDATTIDALASRYQLDRIDLLKIDVEGHELDALEGAQQSLRDGRVGRIYTECYGAERQAAVDAFLAPFGFTRAASFGYNLLYERKASAAPKCKADTTPAAAC
jgi:FkbM family methyltransferase